MSPFKHRKSFNGCLLLLLFFLKWGQSGLAVSQDATEMRLQQIENRLQSIDSKLNRLENILFATIKFSELQARKQLNEARQNLAQSERLHASGLLSLEQLRLDRMSVQREETLLKMCLQEANHRKIGATLDWLDAKQDLERKKLLLEQTLEMVGRGLAARAQVINDQQAVLLAGQKLKLAEKKLKSLESSSEKRNPD
ncbi:MAG: hypothetical protein VX768_01310 [Planctomycetota bacterium]|nr:hypothetical protein [Planctomycetota bacterium]